MTIFKCKMCGGTLEIENGKTVAVCEYCGTQQTLPKTEDENLQGLYNRANVLRMKSEFDKAEKIYEKIIEADSTQAEAYWGLILCKYGIEYVDDPVTFKKIPTCHRTSYDSIIADDDYKAAINNADMSQRALYEEQAKEIDRIQKEILAIAQNEDPYDVFICYKETDNSGKRTQDSVIANDIYYQLTQEGFKVFYAAITLEGKLGSAYEPIIFAALNSSKVMLAIGTKPEHFDAVWVKNEWSRFLKIIKNDRSKLLIPCYRDMDAYELPEEFAHLQAQDMSKIGFINDIVRGIKKVLVKDSPKEATVIKETVVSGGNTNIAPLLKRAFMFLEDGDWNSANEYCEKVLDIEPECAEAYLGKLMAELRVRKQENLADCAQPFESRNNYQKCLRFCDEKTVNELKGYIDYIKTRNENERLERAYNEAVSSMNKARTQRAYLVASESFGLLGEYKDSATLAEECLKKAEIARKDAVYAEAKSKAVGETVSSYEEAVKLFESIPGWKDSDGQVFACQKKIKEIEEKAEADRIERERKAEADRIEKERREEAERIEAKKRAKRNTIIAVVTVAVVCICIAFIAVWNNVIIPNNKYNDALDLMKAGKYSEAITAFEAMNGYKDSDTKITECENAIIEEKYNKAVELMKSGLYRKAISSFKALNGYKDCEAKIAECNTAILDEQYNEAITLLNDGKFTEAIEVLKTLNGHKDSEAKIEEAKLGILDATYNDAIALLNNGKFAEAIEIFETLNGHKDSEAKIEEARLKILKAANVGDIVEFGDYEQDGKTANGSEPIQWIVMEKKGNNIVLLSQYILATEPFDTQGNNNWDNSSLKVWLNKDFMAEAFKEEEQGKIQSTSAGKVYLLSESELGSYYGDLTTYSVKSKIRAKLTVAGGSSGYEKYWWWWTRTSDGYHNAAYCVKDVDEYGNSSGYSGTDASAPGGGVRPAITITIS